MTNKEIIESIAPKERFWGSLWTEFKEKFERVLDETDSHYEEMILCRLDKRDDEHLKVLLEKDQLFETAFRVNQIDLGRKDAEIARLKCFLSLAEIKLGDTIKERAAYREGWIRKRMSEIVFSGGLVKDCKAAECKWVESEIDEMAQRLLNAPTPGAERQIRDMEDYGPEAH